MSARMTTLDSLTRDGDYDPIDLERLTAEDWVALRPAVIEALRVAQDTDAEYMDTIGYSETQREEIDGLEVEVADLKRDVAESEKTIQRQEDEILGLKTRLKNWEQSM